MFCSSGKGQDGSGGKSEKTLGDFAAEYAKSNRSTCKGCMEKIEKVGLGPCQHFQVPGEKSKQPLPSASGHVVKDTVEILVEMGMARVLGRPSPGLISRAPCKKDLGEHRQRSPQSQQFLVT